MLPKGRRRPFVCARLRAITEWAGLRPAAQDAVRGAASAPIEDREAHAVVASTSGPRRRSRQEHRRAPARRGVDRRDPAAKTRSSPCALGWRELDGGDDRERGDRDAVEHDAPSLGHSREQPAGPQDLVGLLHACDQPGGRSTQVAALVPAARPHVDSHGDRPAATAELPPPPGQAERIACIATLVPVKNHAGLLDAFRAGLERSRT